MVSGGIEVCAPMAATSFHSAASQDADCLPSSIADRAPGQARRVDMVASMEEVVKQGHDWSKPRRIKCSRTEVHPFHRPAAPSSADCQVSRHTPVVLTPNPMATAQGQVVNGTNCPRQHVDINNDVGVPFETDAFVGRIYVHIRNLPTSRKDLFAGKKRATHCVVQGKFKRPVDAATLCMGQEFVKNPPSDLPQWTWIAEWSLGLVARRFSNTAILNLAHREEPGIMMNPILAVCQIVNVSREGEQPKAMEATEDLRLWSEDLTARGKPMDSEKRRKWCDQPENLAGRVLGTEHVWTFHTWQHILDIAAYKFTLAGMLSMDISATLMAQPLQMTVKDLKTGEYLVSLLMWHEKLLQGDEEALKRSQSAVLGRVASLAKMGSNIRGALSFSSLRTASVS